MELSAELSERPRPDSSIRYLVIAVSVMMSLKLYLDRFSISFTERYIKEELGLSEFAVASFLGVGFFLSYAIGQVPAGGLSDRFGPRTMLAMYILVWSTFTALTGLVNGFLMLMIARLGCGLGQAGAYPSCGNLLSKWVPLSSRARASSFVAFGGRLGAVVAPILTAFLMVAFVPLSTPVDVTAEQILDGPKLCSRLVPADDSKPTAGGLLASWLPDNLREPIQKAGRQYLAWEQEVKSLESQSPAPTAEALESLRSRKPQLSPEEQRHLAGGLNLLIADDRLHRDRWLSDPKHPFSRLNIEREAQVAMRQLESGKSLSPEEARRLNRLILEAALPELRKLYGLGWRPVFWLYGSAGIVVAAVFYFLFRDHPREHPWCNATEIAVIEEGKSVAATSRSDTGIPWGALVRSPSLWLSSVSQFSTNIGWLFVVTYMPRYLMEVHQVPIYQRSLMVMIPACGGILGMFLGGALTDGLTRRLGLRWGRALPMGLTRFGAAAAYVACLWLNDPWAATIALTLVFFFTDLGVSAVWAFVQDVGGRNVGSVLGWGNMWGNIGAALAPWMYAACLGGSPQIGDWNETFLLCAGMFVVSGLAALAIDSTRPIVTEQP